MRGRAEDQRQHADPDDLVDERRRSGGERHGEEEEPGAIAWPLLLEVRDRRLRAIPREHPRASRDRDVDQRCDPDGPGQSHGTDEHEPADHHSHRRAEAVREIQHRDRAAGAVRKRA